MPGGATLTVGIINVRHVFALIALVTTVRAAASFPALTGDLSGSFELAGAPAIHWTILAQPADKGQRAARLEADAEGLSVRAELRSDLSTGELTWQLEQASVDLALWADAAANYLALRLPALAASGKVRLSGVGTIENGVPTGSVAVECTDVMLRDPIRGWKMDGIGLHGQFAVSGITATSTTPLELTVGNIATSRFGARGLLIRGELKAGQILSVSAARVEIAGGEMEAEPFDLLLGPPVALNTQVHLRRIGLEDVVALFPSGLSFARGRLHGDVRIGWNSKDGFDIGIGSLRFDDVEPTYLRLAPNRGLFTGRLPGWYSTLFGALGGMLFSSNPVQDLSKVELGETELQVNSLEIKLTPQDSAMGRSATVLVDARPVKSSSIERVRFTVNVHGPLAEVLRLTIREPVSLDVR